MCLHPHPVDPVPEETARVARAAFPKGNTYMTMRNEVGAIFSDEDFTELFPGRGRPAFSPWRLALVTIMAFAEGLSDRQAADAVRGRIDYKYALSLELTDPGFDASVLCEFRARLGHGGREERLFDILLNRFREMGLIKARGRQRTDSTYVLGCARSLNRLELVGETMRQALNALAVAAPEWLRHRADPEWASRYGLPADDLRLPTGQDRRREEAERIGAEGFGLLEAIYGEDGPDWLAEIPAVETMRQVWVQNYLQSPEGIAWRTSEDGLPPAATRIDSPTDPECHSSRGKSVAWLGYKVHLTETCDEGYPNLITNVETTTAPVPDTEATTVVHRQLEAKELLPTIHLVDTGYMDARWLVEARRDYGVDLLGPMRGNYSPQAREGAGFDLASFEIDWERRVAICPEGKESSSWTPRIKDGKSVTIVQFSAKDCSVCPSKELSIRSDPRRKGQPKKSITVVSKDHHEALRTARQRESTAEYGREYARREGIEGTVSRTVRTCGVRRTRYRGLKKSHLGHVLTAASVNFLRVGEWICGSPRPPSRSSPFVKLMGQQGT